MPKDYLKLYRDLTQFISCKTKIEQQFRRDNLYLKQNWYSESEVQAKDKEIQSQRLEIEKLRKDNARLKLRVKYQWKED